MKRLLYFLLLFQTLILETACHSRPDAQDMLFSDDRNHHETLPITGTWINLSYKDVRNKYTNPLGIDMTSPEFWETKVREMAGAGLEYLVLMEVADNGKAFYPSGIMPPQYDPLRKSPVEAILDEAAKYGLKVFLSTGWARNQDDNLKIPEIRHRQLQIMDEIGTLYVDKPAFYGWYLPVEDCIRPIFPKTAVEAVNALVMHAHQLTPGKKTMISPYGLIFSDFNHPDFESSLSSLKVDIIAYQDEVGCVREPVPLPRLRRNWKRLREVHNNIGIEMWANCETFTWENGTNDRSSALIPAAYQRLLTQQVAASAAGADRIISFMFPGIMENPGSPFMLGQPEYSGRAWSDYMAWKSGDRYWKLSEAAHAGHLANAAHRSVTPVSRYRSLFDGICAEEDPHDSRWTVFGKGMHEIVMDLQDTDAVHEIMFRFLNFHSQGIHFPDKLYIFVSENREDWNLVAVRDFPQWKNNLHDAWCDHVLVSDLNLEKSYVKVAFPSSGKVYVDEIFINPSVDCKNYDIDEK